MCNICSVNLLNVFHINLLNVFLEVSGNSEQWLPSLPIYNQIPSNKEILL